ncbi:MAG: hypothetical protein DWQ31_08640 [Planctomycetota bacterium]|nr:MAG: hypothetical protein DWQ31_08640 [Planctomycetota bacterium]REJ86940.1 MAG: hypothetical protein DWQ35_22530 [Planctomycetota bacterium]REK24933.1 MAG: hypothetical protein DWQ42_12640 [Planctomycetota bacterium]REK48522.1 MAG: hypothetical protein DWQ46_02170 [Planctomycetota bacterium]
MLRDQIQSILKERYGSISFEFGGPSESVVRVASCCQDIGELQIYDDGDEATIYVTEVTHGHFNPYDATQGEAELVQWIVDEVVEFLDALFEDRVLLYRSPDRGMGGWIMFDDAIDKSEMVAGREYFVWSGPVA